MRRILLCLVMAAGLVAVAATPAQAAGCARTSNHAGYVTYNCYMYRSSVHVWNHWSSGANYNLADNASGVLNQGTSWFVCQRRFPVDVTYGSAANNWWAYTLSDNGWWGWVNAVYVSGGANWGALPGLATCSGSFGTTTSYPGDPGACATVALPVDGAQQIEFTAANSQVGGVC